MQGGKRVSHPALDGLLGAVNALERELDAFVAEVAGAHALPRAQAESSPDPAHVLREPAGPWTVAAAPPAPPAAPLASRGAGLGADRSPVCCAVIDDDAAARLGLSLLLEGWGLEVQAFAGLAEAERAWRDGGRGAPDLLITDYHLPRPADGLVAIYRCRALWPQRTIPALLLTGDSSVCTDAPATRVMFKPVAPLLLREGIDQALAGAA